MRYFLLAFIAVASNLYAATIGAATGYNVFAFDTININGFNTGGAVAGGGTATFGNLSIGTSLSPNAARLDLILGSDVVLNGTLTLSNGSGTYAGTRSGSGFINAVQPGATFSQAPSAINFGASISSLTQLAATLAGVAQNGTWSVHDGGLYLSGSDPEKIVFDIPDGALTGVSYVNVDGLSGSGSIILNVADRFVSISSAGLDPLASVQSRLLWNFANADPVIISNATWRGSILAPQAVVSISNAQFYGQVIGKGLSGNNGGTQNVLYDGWLPSVGSTDVPEPGTVALVGLGLASFSVLRRRRA